MHECTWIIVVDWETVHSYHESALGCISVHLDHWSALEWTGMDSVLR